MHALETAQKSIRTTSTYVQELNPLGRNTRPRGRLRRRRVADGLYHLQVDERCVRCWTRYCDATCQHDHWRRGHKQICKKIHRGGNAEQYNADKKYKEAVAVAVEAYAPPPGSS